MYPYKLKNPLKVNAVGFSYGLFSTKPRDILSAENASHLSLVGGKYHIPDKDIEEFYHLYSEISSRMSSGRESQISKSIFCGRRQNRVFRLIELIKGLSKKKFLVCCVFETPMRMVCTDFT